MKAHDCFVVVFTLYEASKRHELRAELFLKCAQALSELYDTIRLDQAASKMDIEKLKEHYYNYNKILGNYLDNHSDLDHHVFRMKNKKIENINDLFEKIYIRFSNFANVWIMPGLALVSPCIIYLFMIIVLYMYNDANSMLGDLNFNRKLVPDAAP